MSAPDFGGDLSGADDATVRAALAHAEFPALLPALAALLGDPSLVPDHLQPDPTNVMDPNGGLSPAQLAEAHELAFGAICRLRDTAGAGGATALPDLDVDELRHLLGYVAGGAPVDDYLELLREELSLDEDLRTPTWAKDELAPDRPFRVAVIGAGMSGLLAAYRLRQAGLDVVVLEKNADVGGTWFENTYPGCRVDVANLFYSYSFAQRNDWPDHFSPQPVLLDYFRTQADQLGLRPLIRFGTEVTAVELDESTMTWALQLAGPGGTEDVLEAHAVVSAVGQLNRPNMPDIAGIDRFEGPSFHSARWDHGVDLAGKKVVVIGTGASAAQFIPIVADEAADLTVLQRTPAWFLPTPDYHDHVEAPVHWLMRNIGGYANWIRFWVFWRNVEGLLSVAHVDPEWDGGGRSVSVVNDGVRQLLVAYLQGEFAAAPELVDKVTPDYPPFAKRFIRDNGIWARTLTRDDVHLVTDGIDAVVAEGVRTVDGTVHEADVIIYGTGFQASDFLMPMKVVGRGGVELHERWGGDARAHLGVTLPDFPNLFLMYGPNTNIVVNGSITYFSECEVTYVLACLRHLLATGARALVPTSEAHDAYNERVDAENRRMAWGVSSVNSWYKNATGRSAQNWPFSLLDYWRQTRDVDVDQYEVL
jgi:4-hydroxyacetophenone monooxygenase